MYTEGTLFDGRYLLKERKGRGSFGEVWLAEDKEIGVDFAIKIYVAMDEKGLDEFRKEYQLSCNLINSNLLHINKMEICAEDGCPYLVMPYCPRGASSLVGRMEEVDLWHFLQNVANGLAYLHDQTPPIIHQDIKPDNILQMQSGDFVITDFGISKQLRGTRRSAGGDSSGAVAYMGPERFKAGYTSIKSSDIWSLGATIYEMATGQLPFEGKGGRMQDAGFETPSLPMNFTQELNDTMQACMNPEPWSRPSARQLADYASEILKGRKVQPPFSVPASSQPVRQPIQQPVQQPIQQPVQQPVQQPAQQPAPQAQYSTPQQPVTTPSKSKMPLYIGAGVVACVILGLVAFFALGRGNGESTEEVLAQTEDVQTPASAVVQTEVLPVAQEPTEPVSSPSEQVAQPAAEPVATPSAQPAEQPAEPKPEKKADEPKAEKSGSGSLSLSYGKYTGAIKNGYPDGKGKLVYTTSRQINKYDSKGRMASPGDYVEGYFVNGFFTAGKHYGADGELIEKISVGVADGVFESK